MVTVLHLGWWLKSEVSPRCRRRDPPPGGPQHHSGTDKIGLTDLLDGAGFLPHRHRQGVDPDRATVVSGDQGIEDRSVEPVESELVDIEAANKLIFHILRGR